MTKITERSTFYLLNRFVYGVEPANCRDIEAELERRGIILSELTEEIDDLINKYNNATDQS